MCVCVCVTQNFWAARALGKQPPRRPRRPARAAPTPHLPSRIPPLTSPPPESPRALSTPLLLACTGAQQALSINKSKIGKVARRFEGTSRSLSTPSLVRCIVSSSP